VDRPETYPAEARITRAQDFRAVLEQGEAFPGRVALVRRLARPQGPARLGLSVPRGYGDAAHRNRFRRLAREVFRRLRLDLPPMDLLVSPRRGGEAASLEALRTDLERAARAPPGSGAPARRRR
jgi:ribonuclease P protein component